MNNYNFWFWLGASANFAQLESYEMLKRDAKNNDLLDYLQHQDKDLLNKIIDQNAEIINQNQIIIDLLAKGENKDARKN